MPLKIGSSEAVITENIQRLTNEGYSREQSTAIAYSKAGKSAEALEALSGLGWTETQARAWLETFLAVLNQTQDEIAALLAAQGRAIKSRCIGLKSVSADGAIVGGWGLLFSDSQDADLTGTYFTEETELLLDFYEGAPLFWDHGKNKSFGVAPIGVRTAAKIYPHGVWVEHRLFTDHPRYQEILDKVQRGLCFYSSDSIEHFVLRGWHPRDGKLDLWPMVGLSLTDQPAEPGLGPVTVRSFELALKSLSEAREAQGSGEESPVDTPSLAEKDFTMDEMMQKIASFLGLGEGATPEDVKAGIEAFIAEMTASGTVPPELADALGLAAGATVDDVAGKLRALVNPPDAAAQATPMPEAATPVPAMRNYEALKAATGIAAKSAQYERTMPYAVVPAGSQQPREYTTRTFNVGRNLSEPGVFEAFQDMVLMSRGQAPKTFKGAKSMSYATGPTGGYILNQEISDNILDPLRAEAVVFKLGARQEDLDGIQVKTIPAMSTAPSAYWPGEGQTVTDSQPAYRTLNLVPKPLAVLVKRPFSFFKNMTPRAEQQLRAEIQRSLALEVDRVALLGIGAAQASPNTGAQPLGLLNITGVTQTTLATNGRTPTLQDLITLDGNLDDANVQSGGRRGWAFHPRTKRVFTGMADANGQPVLRESWGSGAGAEIIGYPYAQTTQVPINVTTGSNTDTSYIFFGDWQYMVVGMSAQVELVLDQTYAASLMQGLLAYVYVDVAVDYVDAFEVLVGVRGA